ncbi:MAG: hypothetical protein AAF963_01370, partial [Bacteroidota bacterium]
DLAPLITDSQSFAMRFQSKKQRLSVFIRFIVPNRKHAIIISYCDFRSWLAIVNMLVDSTLVSLKREMLAPRCLFTSTSFELIFQDVFLLPQKPSCSLAVDIFCSPRSQ